MNTLEGSRLSPTVPRLCLGFRQYVSLDLASFLKRLHSIGRVDTLLSPVLAPSLDWTDFRPNAQRTRLPVFHGRNTGYEMHHDNARGVETASSLALLFPPCLPGRLSPKNKKEQGTPAHHERMLNSEQTRAQNQSFDCCSDFKAAIPERREPCLGQRPAHLLARVLLPGPFSSPSSFPNIIVMIDQVYTMQCP